MEVPEGLAAKRQKYTDNCRKKAQETQKKSANFERIDEADVWPSSWFLWLFAPFGGNPFYRLQRALVFAALAPFGGNLWPLIASESRRTAYSTATGSK